MIVLEALDGRCLQLMLDLVELLNIFLVALASLLGLVVLVRLEVPLETAWQALAVLVAALIAYRDCPQLETFVEAR